MSTLTNTSHISKRSRGAVSECYASSRGYLRLVGDPTYDLYHSSERKRTSGGSSDDQDSVQEDGFVNEAFRAGGPQLCTVPVATRSIASAHPSYHFLTINMERLTASVMSILENAGIRSDKTILFCTRQSIFEKESEPVLTLLIEAHKTAFDDTWVNASREIHGFFCNENLPELTVEIADNRAFDPDKVFPLHPRDPIYSQWYDVVQSIWTHCYLEHVNTIGCFRIGKSDNWEQNPPTVLITVNPNTDLEWKTMREDVVLILENHYLPMVAVKIQRDEVLRSSGLIRTPDMPLDVLQGSALVGQSLGRRGLDDKQGTFGGFIEIQDPYTHEWVCLGISCTHCVLPDDNQVEISKVHGKSKILPFFHNTHSRAFLEIQNWRANGVLPDDPNAQFLEVDHPSSKDLQQAIEACDSRVAWIADDEYHMVKAFADAGEPIEDRQPRFNRKKGLIEQCEEEKTTIENFRNSQGHHFGSVFAASGETVWCPSTMTEPRCIMDWALISIPASRAGDNQVNPTGIPSTWIISLTDSSQIATFGPLPREFMVSQGAKLLNWDHKPLEARQMLYKCGRLTGYTSGRYSGVKTVHLRHELVNGEMIPTCTWEHTITNAFQAFSGPGDSGSLVFDVLQGCVGLVYGGNERSNISYFTHVTDLFDHIMHVTGATGVRMMG